MLIKCMNHLERFMNEIIKSYVFCILYSTHPLTSLQWNLQTCFNVSGYKTSNFKFMKNTAKQNGFFFHYKATDAATLHDMFTNCLFICFLLKF